MKRESITVHLDKAKTARRVSREIFGRTKHQVIPDKSKYSRKLKHRRDNRECEKAPVFFLTSTKLQISLQIYKNNKITSFCNICIRIFNFVVTKKPPLFPREVNQYQAKEWLQLPLYSYHHKAALIHISL